MDHNDHPQDNQPVVLNYPALIETGPQRRSRGQRQPELSLVTGENAEDILHGSDTELRRMAKRLGRAKAAAARQTANVYELKRRLSGSEPSLNLKAQNKRLRKDLNQSRQVIALYRSGQTALADELADIVMSPSSAARQSELISRKPGLLVSQFAEWSEERSHYIYDDHGHRVRRDMVDSGNECAECKRENQRRSAQQQTG